MAMDNATHLAGVSSEMYERKWERFYVRRPAKVMSVRPGLTGSRSAAARSSISRKAGLHSSSQPPSAFPLIIICRSSALPTGSAVRSLPKRQPRRGEIHRADIRTHAAPDRPRRLHARRFDQQAAQAVSERQRCAPRPLRSPTRVVPARTDPGLASEAVLLIVSGLISLRWNLPRP